MRALFSKWFSDEKVQLAVGVVVIMITGASLAVLSVANDREFVARKQMSSVSPIFEPKRSMPASTSAQTVEVRTNRFRGGGPP